MFFLVGKKWLIWWSITVHTFRFCSILLAAWREGGSANKTERTNICFLTAQMCVLTVFFWPPPSACLLSYLRPGGRRVCKQDRRHKCLFLKEVNVFFDGLFLAPSFRLPSVLFAAQEQGGLQTRWKAQMSVSQRSKCLFRWSFTVPTFRLHSILFAARGKGVASNKMECNRKDSPYLIAPSRRRPSALQYK